ncbi:MAG TPA: hypothetical protein VGL05_15115 [Kribbella sp.]
MVRGTTPLQTRLATLGLQALPGFALAGDYAEACTEADLTEYLNRDLLVALWSSLRLPRRCAALWLQAFPQLAASDDDNQR